VQVAQALCVDGRVQAGDGGGERQRDVLVVGAFQDEPEILVEVAGRAGRREVALGQVVPFLCQHLGGGEAAGQYVEQGGGVESAAFAEQDGLGERDQGSGDDELVARLGE